MTTIKIQAEDEIARALKQIAGDKFITVEALVKEAITNYFQIQFYKKQYSFIGIGNSGKKSISHRVKAFFKP